MAAAQKALAENRTRQKELRAKRDEAAANLRMMMSGVLAEIRVRLSKDSRLWDAFGLSAPKSQKRKVKSEAVVHAMNASVSPSSAIVSMAA